MRDQPFSDVEHDINIARGVLDGDAYRDQERVIERLSDDHRGFDFQCKCQNCGKPAVVSIYWPELVVAGMGVLPLDMNSNQPWAAHQGFMYPPVRCGCGSMLPVPITPDKANRFIETGVKMQCLSAQQVGQMRQSVQQQAPRR